jgi:hypothetical protein
MRRRAVIRRTLGRAARAAALLAAVAPRTAAAQEALPPPPSSSAVCPTIEDAGLLCTTDILSGDCSAFVTAADHLGALYRSELAKLPGSAAELKSTSWWGCGPGSLEDVKALLMRIGTPEAARVLGAEPYRSLPDPPPPPPPSAMPSALSCEDVSIPYQRNACIGVQLDAARAAYRLALERCKAAVDPGLRGDLLAAEASWQDSVGPLCDAQAVGYSPKSQRAFVRARCLTRATQQREQAMLAAHPECAPPD